MHVLKSQFHFQKRILSFVKKGENLAGISAGYFPICVSMLAASPQNTPTGVCVTLATNLPRTRTGAQVIITPNSIHIVG